MAKQKKKRTKVYTGADAADAKPVITRISAVNRSKLGQWWFDRKKFLRPILIAAVVILVVGWLLFELIRIISGS
jgi:hypothetical protein